MRVFEKKQTQKKIVLEELLRAFTNTDPRTRPNLERIADRAVELGKVHDVYRIKSEVLADSNENTKSKTAVFIFRCFGLFRIVKKKKLSSHQRWIFKGTKLTPNDLFYNAEFLHSAFPPSGKVLRLHLILLREFFKEYCNEQQGYQSRIRKTDQGYRITFTRKELFTFLKIKNSRKAKQRLKKTIESLGKQYRFKTTRVNKKTKGGDQREKGYVVKVSEEFIEKITKNNKDNQIILGVFPSILRCTPRAIKLGVMLFQVKKPIKVTPKILKMLEIRGKNYEKEHQSRAIKRAIKNLGAAFQGLKIEYLADTSTILVDPTTIVDNLPQRGGSQVG